MICVRVACLCALLAVAVLAGCGKKAPPPPPPPPPPVVQPAPVEADPRVVARNLVPFYWVLFDRGFNADVVDAEYRPRATWVNPNSPGSYADAWKATPKLTEAAAGLGMTDPSWMNVLREWAKLASEPWWRNPGTVKMRPSVARDVVLAIMMRQAIRDADRKNYHRAHVLLTDVETTMSEESPLREREGRSRFAKFFAEVPDAARFEDFARTLAAYSSTREKEVLVGGEHAAVLHAAGLKAAAEFMREQLLSQFDLITFPMIENAIDKGIKYGFRAPDDVVEIRDRLKSLAQAMRPELKSTGVDHFRSEAVAEPPDEKYRQRIGEFEKLCAGLGGDGEAGVEKRLEELAACQRTVVEWLREKELVTQHFPLQTLRNPVTYRFLELISPLQYDAALGDFRPRDMVALVARRAKLGESLGGWCRGGPLADDLGDGSAYSLLAWYWLEKGRPELARTALIAGARALLDEVRQVPREDLETMGEAAARLLVLELNGYRFLVAAAEIEAAPPGAARGAGARYLPELAVLLERWQGTWARCSLKEDAADRVAGTILDQVEDGGSAARPGLESRERYYFNDYRFAGGPVPQVVLEKAIKESVFGPSGESPPSTDTMLEFFKSFEWPKKFSEGSEARWKTPTKKS